MLQTLRIGQRGRKKGHLVLFVDFKKAFDLVDRQLLLQALSKRVS